MVGTDPDRAFERFTEIGRWWPLAVRSVLPTPGTVGFVDGRLVEQSAMGETAVWGSVTGWAPGVALALTWHPGRTPHLAGRLQITFASTGAHTLVTLEHSGWDGYTDPVGARRDYDHGWPRMLELFRAEAETEVVPKAVPDRPT
jgi:hypothetical protein